MFAFLYYSGLLFLYIGWILPATDKIRRRAMIEYVRYVVGSVGTMASVQYAGYNPTPRPQLFVSIEWTLLLIGLLIALHKPKEVKSTEN